MKKHRLLVLALALVVVTGWMAAAFAADTPAAAAPPAKAEKAATVAAAPAAKPAPAKPKSEIKCEVTGKLDAKTATNKKGKEVKIFDLVVAQAKAADGKAMDGLKGKTLRVAPKKGLAVPTFVGKDVTISGMLINHKKLVPDSIK